MGTSHDVSNLKVTKQNQLKKPKETLNEYSLENGKTNTLEYSLKKEDKYIVG